MVFFLVLVNSDPCEILSILPCLGFPSCYTQTSSHWFLSQTSSGESVGIHLSISHETTYWRPVFFTRLGEGQFISIAWQSKAESATNSDCWSSQCRENCSKEKFTFNTRRPKKQKETVSQQEVGSFGAFPFTVGGSRKASATYVSRWDFWAWLAVGPTQALQLCPEISRGRPSSRMKREMSSRG